MNPSFEQRLTAAEKESGDGWIDSALARKYDLLGCEIFCNGRRLGDVEFFNRRLGLVVVCPVPYRVIRDRRVSRQLAGGITVLERTEK